MIADSKDELNKPVRTKKASAKAAQLLKDKEEKSKTKHKHKSTGESSKTKFKKPETLENRKNIEQLLSDSSEDVVEPVLVYKRKIESLESQLITMKKRKESVEEERDLYRNDVEELTEKIEKIRGENEDLRNLNIELQKRLLFKGNEASPRYLQNKSRNPKSPVSVKKRLFEHVPPTPSMSRNVWEELETSPVKRPETFTTTATPTKKIKISNRDGKVSLHRSQSVPVEHAKVSSSVGKVTPRRSKSRDDAVYSSPLKQGDTTPPSKKDGSSSFTPPSVGQASPGSPVSQSKKSPMNKISLNAATLRMCLHSVRDGAAGDSLYAKNLALALYGEEELRNSSVTGKAFKGSKEAKPKPKLDARKYALLKSLYEKRVKSSTVEGDASEETRLGRLNVYLADKIQKLSQKSKRKS